MASTLSFKINTKYMQIRQAFPKDICMLYDPKIILIEIYLKSNERLATIEILGKQDSDRV